MKLINFAYQIINIYIYISRKKIQIILFKKNIFLKKKNLTKLFELKKLKLKSFNLVIFLGM